MVDPSTTTVTPAIGALFDPSVIRPAISTNAGSSGAGCAGRGTTTIVRSLIR